MNLKLAFQAHGLPAGWELRVEPTTAKPYWVDHMHCSTSYTPPFSQEKQIETQIKPEPGIVNTPPVIPPINTTSCPFPICPAVECLPEYQSYSTRLIQEMEHLHRLNLFSLRCRARVNPMLHGGSKGANQTIEQSIIDESEIVFTTLSGAGHPCMESTDFQIVVVDEAGQSVEPSTLIALRYVSSFVCILC